MVAIAPCPACKEGNHDKHDPSWWRNTPEGQEYFARLLQGELLVGGFTCACPGGCPPKDGVWDGEFWWGPASPAPPKFAYPTETCDDCGLPTDYCGCALNIDEQRWDDNGGA